MMKKIVYFALVLIVFTYAFGCTSYKNYIEGYTDYTKENSENSDMDTEPNNNDKDDSGKDAVEDKSDEDEKEQNDNDTVPETEKIKSDFIDGFAQLNEYVFDYATPFFGNYAYVYDDNNEYLLDKQGKLSLSNLRIDSYITQLHSSMQNEVLCIEDMDGDYLITLIDGKKKIIDCYGNIISDKSYQFVDIMDDYILAYNSFEKGDDGLTTYETELFYQSKLIRRFSSFALFIDEGHLQVGDTDSKFVSLNDLRNSADSESMQQVVYDGKYILSGAYSGGLAKIKYNDSYGYADKEGNIIIQPMFFMSETFSDGYTYCRYSYNSYPVIIDTNGKTVFDFSIYKSNYKKDEIKINVCYGGNIIFTLKNKAYILNMNNLEEPKALTVNLDEIQDGRTYGKYIISSIKNMFYNVDTLCYEAIGYKNIKSAGKYFICEDNDGVYSLLDLELKNIATGYSDIKVYGDTLLLKNDFGYSLYIKN